jgi:hypothetical protein
MHGRKLAISSIVCAAVALTLCVAAGPAQAKTKTTVIGTVTHHTTGLLDPAILQTSTAKKPKKGSITISVTSTPDDPATPNSIYVSGVVECKKKPKDPITKYAIGGEYKAVPSPFTVKAPFPAGVPKPAACRLHISSNVDVPVVYPSTAPYPTATITITVTWRH